VSALDATGPKPSLAQRLLRSTGVRKWTVPAARFDYSAAHPRPAHSGRPPKRVTRRILVERADLGGLHVYEVRPRGIARDALTGGILYLHGGGYVLDLILVFRWPAIAKLANALRRSVIVPIYPLAPEHSYREVFPFRMPEVRDSADRQDFPSAQAHETADAMIRQPALARRSRD
jgi:acetyl esterase/lipase